MKKKRRTSRKRRRRFTWMRRRRKMPNFKDKNPEFWLKPEKWHS